MGLSLTLLGPFQATWDGRPIAFATGAARALLAYLAVEADRAHPREHLAALLWPEAAREGAATNLRQTLARVRRALPGPPAPLPSR
jgi:DNA-binding SARP family transcriptional activator